MKSVSRKALFTTFSLIAICLVIVCPAQAAEFCVSDAAGLQAALTQAASNDEDDTIRIQQGTYVGNFVYASYEANALTIEGGYTSGCASRTIDPANTVLDGNQTGNVLVISTDKATPARIGGVTLQNGVASNGCGGGLYFKATRGNIEISSCMLSVNSAGINGGGVYADTDSGELTMTLIDNTFIGNSADHGGGVYAKTDSGELTMTLTDNTFIGNSAKGGGGVYAYNGTMTLIKNTFIGNSANLGGGVYAYAHSRTYTLILTGNTFTENSGTGVYAKSIYCNLTLTLTNNTFTENSAGYLGGGGVYADVKDKVLALTLTNNTFYANKAESEGGAIRLRLLGTDSIARIYNNILWMNVAPDGADLWIDNDGDNNFLPSPVELFNNDFDQSSTGTCIKIPFTIDPSNLNNVNPLFADPENGDFHLSEGSPCINAGNNSAPELPATDKDGQPRIMDGVVDMGAYECEFLYVEPEGLCGGKLPCYTSIHEAISTSGATAIINIAGGPYEEDLLLDQAKHLTLRGGWDSAFTSQSSNTTVSSMMISNGTTVPDKIILK
jgi:predicted outer membrane repeat protein